MTTLTEAIRIGDVVKWEVNQNFCRAKLALKAVTTQSVKIGSPLRDNTGYVLVANGSEALVTAIALENIEATGGESIVCLVRGPAIIDKDRLTLESNVTWSEIAAALLALGILGASEATLTEGL